MKFIKIHLAFIVAAVYFFRKVFTLVTFRYAFTGGVETIITELDLKLREAYFNADRALKLFVFVI